MNSPKLIKAKYPGWCRGCGARVIPGESVYYDGTDDDGARVAHQDCCVNGEFPDQ